MCVHESVDLHSRDPCTSISVLSSCDPSFICTTPQNKKAEEPEVMKEGSVCVFQCVYLQASVCTNCLFDVDTSVQLCCVLLHIVKGSYQRGGLSVGVLCVFQQRQPQRGWQK